MLTYENFKIFPLLENFQSLQNSKSDIGLSKKI